MNNLEVLPEEKELQVEGSTLIQKAEAFKVSNDLTCQEAVDEGNRIKTKKDWAINFFKPMKAAAKAAHKAICDRENAVVDVLDEAQRLYTQKSADYQLKKQREVEEKERIAKEAAEKKERERREKIDAEARKKEAEEAQAREKARKAQEAADKARREGDKKKEAAERAKAEKAQADADAAEKTSEALREKKENVYVAPRQVAQAVKAQGLSVQAVWAVEITDEKKVPVMWRGEIDLGRLKRAKTANDKLEVPGVRFYEKAQGAALGSR